MRTYGRAVQDPELDKQRKGGEAEGWVHAVGWSETLLSWVYLSALMYCRSLGRLRIYRNDCAPQRNSSMSNPSPKYLTNIMEGSKRNKKKERK